MGSRGPAPKENAVRRNKHENSTELSLGPREARELPRALPVSTAGAKRFWKTWSSSPQSAEWLETDWTELEITTVLVDQLYQGDTKLAGEIRQRVAKWGATAEDRARLRMKLEKPKDESPEKADTEPTDVDIDEELYELLNGE